LTLPVILKIVPFQHSLADAAACMVHLCFAGIAGLLNPGTTAGVIFCNEDGPLCCTYTHLPRVTGQ
jgi:hypothetical protein